ncbi:hypothetical protein JTB14_021750 [Gonioctena quinquepunctata]|nr:hypothetical protein JTB14_021750 [Gonioctena quinquepunctata]
MRIFNRHSTACVLIEGDAASRKQVANDASVYWETHCLTSNPLQEDQAEDCSILDYRDISSVLPVFYNPFLERLDFTANDRFHFHSYFLEG